jgi:hypothetical protein
VQSHVCAAADIGSEEPQALVGDLEASRVNPTAARIRVGHRFEMLMCGQIRDIIGQEIGIRTLVVGVRGIGIAVRRHVGHVGEMDAR